MDLNKNKGEMSSKLGVLSTKKYPSRSIYQKDIKLSNKYMSRGTCTWQVPSLIPVMSRGFNYNNIKKYMYLSWYCKKKKKNYMYHKNLEKILTGFGISFHSSYFFAT